MARNAETNNAIHIRLKNKAETEYTKEDAKEALSLAKSTGRMQDKLMYVSIKHHANHNEDKQQDDNEE